MGRIQSSTGLVTGIDIQGTVDKLIAVQSQPRDLVVDRQKILSAKQTAVSDLTAQVLGVQLAIKRLKVTDAFAQKTVASSNTNLLTATAGTDATAGSYQFVPARRAQTNHLLSSGFASIDEPLGAGSLTIRQGGFLNDGILLDELNGGSGVSRGQIRITDRNGDSGVVDLRFAQTIDDVVAAIHNSGSFAVDAVAEGDHLKLVDRSGGSGNLKVQEVAGGTTAAGLGLASINVAADSATGQDVVRLASSTRLDRLNDGAGLSINDVLADLQVTFQDGSSPLQIDFHRLGHVAAPAKGTTTAANGLDAQLKFTAVQSGSDYDGVTINFTSSGSVTQGNETVAYDSQNKTLTFDIAAGQTTADDVIAALANDSAASQVFYASRASGSNGTGLVDVADTAVTAGGAAQPARNEVSLGDLLQTINEADPTRLKASLDASGDRIVLTDLTSGGGTFAVSSVAGGSLAEELGLTATASGGTIAGQRLLGGLKTTLLNSLSGGAGLGTLGTLQITDRSGATASINLAGAETLDDVISAINAAGIGVTADYNSARNGLVVSDTTGAIASNLIVADGDATGTATKLGLAQSVAATQVSGGSLARQLVSRNTLLSSYNSGQGVSLGSFTIVDSAGHTGTVDLNATGAKTIGDAIDAVNNLSIGVQARLNEAGDGILLVDTAAGSGTLSVKEAGNEHTAADLHILGEAKDITLAGQPAKGIDGTTTFTIEISDTDTLSDLVTKINDLHVGATASVFSDGAGSLPVHLSLLSANSGRAGSLQVDSSAASFDFQELAAGQDALLQLGDSNSTSGGRLIASSSNTFSGIGTGLNVTIAGTSTDPVAVTVSQSTKAVTSAVQLFVDQVNKLQDKIAGYTAYSPTDNTKGTLFGSSETLRIESDLSRLITGKFNGVGSIHSLAELGVSVDENGKLTFDSAQLEAKYTADPAAVERFFSDENLGFAKKIDDAAEGLVGVKNSVLVNRAATLQKQLNDTNSRIDFLNGRLDVSRERLLNQFYNMELVISKLKEGLTSLDSIQYIAPVNRSSST
jgi:flagellar hook-associated protein 2